MINLPNTPEPEGQVDPEIVQIQEEVGVELYDGDPELASLDYTHGIRKYYQSVEHAAKVKKGRAGKLPESMDSRTAWQHVVHKEQ